VLYSDERTETLEQALVAAMDYATRFLIEEFHKGLKTGLKAEELQLETGHRLFAAIAVVATPHAVPGLVVPSGSHGGMHAMNPMR